MSPTWNLVLLFGFYPLFVAWRACAGSTIRHALAWAVVAWAGWCVAMTPEWRYVALCVTACAGVAVLGARRPGAGAWHFVVAMLMVTLLLPLLMGLGELRLQREQVWFLGGVLLVGLSNYLPTRFFLPTALLMTWCALQLVAVSGARTPLDAEPLLLLAVPWIAWLIRPPARLSPIDRAWWLFRHRFGVLWSERMRDQFNRAAQNANLGATLSRGGLVGPPLDEAASGRAESLLGALLGRFDTTSATEE